MSEDNTIVQCRKCGRRQHLTFENGLKNGWSKCCGEIMPIIHCTANIEEVVKNCLKPINLLRGKIISGRLV